MEISDIFPLRNINWMRNENFHVALHFIGEVTEKNISKLKKNLTEAFKEEKKFYLVGKGISFEPSGDNPRMIWARFVANNEYKRLAGKVARVCRPFMRKEKREKLIPHITLGRFKDPDIAKGIELPNIRGKMKIEKVLLLSSEPSEESSYYTVLKEFPLE